MKRTTQVADLVLGGVPRSELLPPQFKALRQWKIRGRILSGAVVVTVVIISGGIGAAAWEAANEEQALAAAQEQVELLQAEAAEFAEVRQLQRAIATTIDARRLGASMEVDWKLVLEGIREVLPADVTVSSVRINAGGVLGGSPETLAQSSVASLDFTLLSPTLPSVPDWLAALATLPGYATATPELIERTADGFYAINLTMQINAQALSNRFASEE